VSAGLELSRRRLEVPGLGCTGGCRTDWSEWLHRAYLALPFGQRTAVSIAWRYERLTFDEDPAALLSFPYRTRTEMLPLGLWHRLGERFSARIEAVKVRQEAAIFDGLAGRRTSRSEDFWLANASLSYARPGGQTSVALIVQNVADRDFAFQDTDLNGDPKTPLFYPSRTVLLQANLRF
jgi:hypothetical protein